MRSPQLVLLAASVAPPGPSHRLTKRSPALRSRHLAVNGGTVVERPPYARAAWNDRAAAVMGFLHNEWRGTALSAAYVAAALNSSTIIVLPLIPEDSFSGSLVLLHLYMGLLPQSR